jgi:putative ABC transport system permease protein
MIAIITYVSVVERIKEIGVIRALGGRKKDVSNLFNAETLVIGLSSGLIGVGFTYLMSVIVNVIVKHYAGFAIMTLPFSSALIMIALSVGLTVLSGLIPARKAAHQDPVVALRTE